MHLIFVLCFFNLCKLCLEQLDSADQLLINLLLSIKLVADALAVLNYNLSFLLGLFSLSLMFRHEPGFLLL